MRLLGVGRAPAHLEVGGADVLMVMWFRLFVPADPLSKTRLAAVVISSCSLLAQLTQLTNPTKTLGWRYASAAAIVAIVAVLVVTYRRARLVPLDGVLVPTLVWLGGSGLHDPVITTGLSIGALLVLSLYGSFRVWLLRCVAGVVAIPAAVATSPMIDDRPISWASPTVFNVVPQVVLVCSLMRGIYVALLRQHAATARDAVLARVGGELLAADDPPRIRAVAQRALDELAPHSGGAAAIIVAGRGGAWVVDRVYGTAAPVAGTLSDASVAALRRGDEIMPWIELTTARRVDGPWLLLGTVDVASPLWLLLRPTGPTGQGVAHTYRTLWHQVQLGMAGSLSRAELTHRAYFDALTELPNRALFLQRLQTALNGAAAARTAVLSIDLDDFKWVNDVYGHAAGDELLVIVARRLDRIAAATATAARLGGDEFVLLLTDVASTADAGRVAHEVNRALAQPVALTAATVTIGSSIGVATAANGAGVDDILRTADTAMYAAKRQGKNRVACHSGDAVPGKPGSVIAEPLS